MAPLAILLSRVPARRQSPAGASLPVVTVTPGDWRAAAASHPEDLILESWSQGVVVGALLIMACITIANMRRSVLLHKLILLELFLAMSHGTFCFMDFKGYGWYLSSTAMLLYFSWIIHNVVAWMKVKPFFTQPGGFFSANLGLWVRRIYLGTLALTVPVIVFQITNNFRFFNNLNGWYKGVRPYEPLMRDPWWVFTCIALFHVIRKCYGTGVLGLVRRSPRFGILLTAICLSIIFTVLDIVASINHFLGTTDGINPWWKLSLVFKCLTDTIMLDDFKTELKRLGIKRIAKEEAKRNSIALVSDYPTGLNGPDSETYQGPRRGTMFPYNPVRSKTFSCSDDLEQGIDSNDFVREVNPTPSPPSSSIVEKKEGARKAGTNDANANMEELEFATALALDPRRVSGVESVGTETNRVHSERGDVRKSTKKIGRLPGLKEFRFEAIKPGKKQSGYAKTQSRRREDDEEEVSPADATGHQDDGPLDSGDQQTLQRPKRKSRQEPADDSDDEDMQRFRRFRASIGAASSGAESQRS